MPATDMEGTINIKSPAQNAPALRVKDYSKDRQLVPLIEREYADGTRVPFSGPSLDELRMQAEGFVAQTFPRQYAAQGGSPGSGTLRLSLLYLRRGLILTNAHVIVSANGAGVTLGKVGLWRASDGALVAATPDFSSLLQSGTITRDQAQALITPYTVPADGPYFTGYLMVGTTPPSLGTSTGNVTTPNGGPGLYPHGASTGQSDLPNPVVVGGGGVVPWVGFN